MSASTALRLEYWRMTFARSHDGRRFFAKWPKHFLGEVSFAIENGQWCFRQYAVRRYGLTQEELRDIRDFLQQLNRLGGPDNLPPLTNHYPEPES